VDIEKEGGGEKDKEEVRRKKEVFGRICGRKNRVDRERGWPHYRG
jgi:hypothetical protein